MQQRNVISEFWQIASVCPRASLVARSFVDGERRSTSCCARTCPWRWAPPGSRGGRAGSARAGTRTGSRARACRAAPRSPRSQPPCTAQHWYTFPDGVVTQQVIGHGLFLQCLYLPVFARKVDKWEYSIQSDILGVDECLFTNAAAILCPAVFAADVALPAVDQRPVDGVPAVGAPQLLL